MSGGYCDCACRDCFDVAITSTDHNELCGLCADAGCDPNGEDECQREDAYLDCPTCSDGYDLKPGEQCDDCERIGEVSK